MLKSRVNNKIDFFYLVFNILIFALYVINFNVSKILLDYLIIFTAFINILFFLFKFEDIQVKSFFLVFFGVILAFMGTLINNAGLGAFFNFFNFCMFLLLFAS